MDRMLLANASLPACPMVDAYADLRYQPSICNCSTKRPLNVMSLPATDFGLNAYRQENHLLPVSL
jgi:hypothetical protein